MRHAVALLALLICAYAAWNVAGKSVRRQGLKFVRKHGSWVALIAVAIAAALLSAVYTNAVSIT